MSVTAVPIRPIRKGSLVKLWVGLGALALVAAGVAWAGTGDQVAMASPEAFLADNAGNAGVITTPSGLQIKTVEPGSGAKVGINDGVIIEYTGRLVDGTVFDSTEGKGPAPMLVRQVVPGFSEALQQMQSGGSYRIWLPPALGYGDQVPPGGPIPPNAVLDFDVKVLQVVPNAALQVGPGALPPGM
jgi:FKBP-type peptidyl-prolyl cis-trans isomerase FkpA